MSRTWLFTGLLLLAFAVFAFGQQADEPSDQARIVQLEKQMEEMRRMLAPLKGDGAIGMTPSALELRLSRIEARLDRLEQQSALSANSSGVSPDRMMESRLRTLEYAVMRLQQQR